MKRMIAVDGHSLLYRAFYALPGFTTKSGQQTGAVYGFNLMLEKILSDYNPDYVFVAFDSGKPTFRHEQFEDYKAQRPPMPDDLRPQVEIVKELLDHLGIPHIAIDGIEADDLIGTVSVLAKDWDTEFLILTGDRDSLQLINDYVNVLLTKKGISEIVRYDEKTVLADFSIKPDQVIDYKGLVGDPSDNIPGVKGIGDKTAIKLLSEFKNLEEILKNTDNLSAAVAKKIKGNEEIAILSKELATIKTDCCLSDSLNLETMKLKDPEIEPLRDFYTRLEFTSFLKKLPESKEMKRLKEEIELIPKLDKFDQELLEKEEIVYLEDLTDGYLLSSPTWCLLVPKKTLSLFEQEEFDVIKLTKDKRIFTFGAKALYLKEAELQIEDDLELAGYLLDPDFSHDIFAISEKYLGLVFNDSLRERATLAWLLKDRLRDELAKKELTYLYEQVELPLSKVLATMEKIGIKVDKDKLAQLSLEFSQKMAELEKKIFGLSGEEFNINSSKQLGEILFDKLGLPAQKKTKTGYSTSADVLEKLAFIHPLPNLVIEYRQLQKLKSTYTDALQDLINPNTGRIHTSFNQLVTATGRLSSSNPNLQNIPVRTEEGVKIRGCFVPEEGNVFLSADYSQIELRVLAHISGDPDLIATFQHGEDIHARTAAEVLDKEIETVTDEERSWAKAINFGIIYGISGFGLARNTDLNKKQAEKYIEKYLSRYPKVRHYMDTIVSDAREKGYVKTLLNRRRYLPEINSSNFLRRSLSERMALNTPIQGTAADIIKLAMLKIDQSLRLSNLKTRMILQVHDELVLEVPERELDEVIELIKEVLVNAYNLETKLETVIRVGIDWLNMSKR